MGIGKIAGKFSLHCHGGHEDETEIYYLSVFNHRLYAVTVNFETGFEAWKITGQRNPANPDKLLWKQVIRNDLGDSWNRYGISMQPFEGCS
jgi:hypothetical protein